MSTVLRASNPGRTGFARTALLGIAAALLAGAWLALQPAPAEAHGRAGIGTWSPSIRVVGETGNYCTNTRTYAANGGTNTVDLRIVGQATGDPCQSTSTPLIVPAAAWNWRRYAIKVGAASADNNGSTGAIDGAHIEYVSGIASGTGSWRSVAGTKYNWRCVGTDVYCGTGLETGHIGSSSSGPLSDLRIRFTVPESHVGSVKLVFTIGLNSANAHEHATLTYGDPHVAALPLAVPQDSGGTLDTVDVTAATRQYAANGASQRARVFLRDAWHSNQYTAAETNAARSAFDSAAIKVTSDAAGANVISGAKISSDAAGNTAIAACTETSPGDTCTITSANFPQDSATPPKTTPQDIYFSVPSSHSGSAYLVVTTSQSSKTSRSFSAEYNDPGPPIVTPIVPTGTGTPQVQMTAAETEAVRGRPLGFATQLLRGGRPTMTFAELDADAALALTAQDGKIIHEQFCPHIAPDHPFDTTPLATSTSCTITRAALMAFQRATAADAVQKVDFVYIADSGSASGGQVDAVWKTTAAEYTGNQAFTHADDPDPTELEVSAFFDWADKGTDYATAGPTAMFAIGRSGAEVSPQAMPSGLAWARFNELEDSGTAVRLSIDRGTLSYNGAECAADGPCRISLTLAQLMAERSAMASDLSGNLRVGYALPLGETATLTVEAWPDDVATPASGTLALGSPAAGEPTASVTPPDDADRLLAPGQTAAIAAGFSIPVDAAGELWACAGFGPSFLELTAPQQLANGCLRTRSAADPAEAPSLTEQWLTDDSYLAISGPATFADGGGKRLPLDATWSHLRCGTAQQAGADAADGRIACWATNAAGEPPKIVVDADADADIRIIASIVVAEDRTLRLFTGPGRTLPFDRFAQAAAFDLPDKVAFGSGTLSVGTVKELDSISIGRAPINGAVPTAPIAAGTTGQNLRLSILNENGTAARLAALSSITVLATGGSLSGYGCETEVSCTISTAAGGPLAQAASGNPAVIAAIDLAYRPPAQPGSASIVAAVVGADGSSLEQTLALDIAGPAAALEFNGAMPIAHSAATPNDDRDQVKIKISAQDAAGNAAPMPSDAQVKITQDDDSALPANSHTAVVECKDQARFDCEVIVTVTAPTSSPLPAGAYTATVTGTGITDAQSSFNVAGPVDAVTLEIPDQPGNVADSFTATAQAADQDGNAVADGTWIAFSTAAAEFDTPPVLLVSPPLSDHDNDAATAEQRRAQTKNGAATANAVIISRGIALLSASAAGASSILPIDLRAAQTAAQPPSVELSAGPNELGPGFYRGSTSSTAAEILALGPETATVVWFYNGRRWLRYSETDGQSPPGSISFTVFPNDFLWFGSN